MVQKSLFHQKNSKTNMKAESEKEELCRVSWCHQSIGAFSIIRENRNIETFIQSVGKHLIFYFYSLTQIL